MTIDIIIPCRNEVKYIAKCIDAILESDYKKELLTIYIIDGVSDDGTLSVIENYIRTNNNIVLITNYKKFTPQAFNLGISKSLSDVVFIIGSRSIIAKDYLKKCIEIFKNDKSIDCVGGLAINIYENEISEIIGLAMSSSFGVGNAYFRTGLKSGFVDTVGTPAYRRTVFSKIGIFDENLIRNQDDDFNFRLTKAGSKIYLDTSILYSYYVRADYTKLYKQYFQYGYWKVYVNNKHKTITSLRQLAPLTLVLSFLFSILMVFLKNNLIYLPLLILVTYTLMAIYFSLKKTNSIKKVFRLIKVFIIIHVGYGIGYLISIIHIYIIKKKPSENVKKISR